MKHKEFEGMRKKLSQGKMNSGQLKVAAFALVALTMLTTWTSGCSDARHRHRDRDQEVQTGVTPPAGNGSVAPGEQVNGDAQVLEAQDRHRKKIEVTFTAPVKKLLEDDTKGIDHQRFLVELSNGSTVLVAHNTDLAPPVPVHEGDLVTMHGEYIWNRKGGVLHYTHHSTTRHESGWIQFNGQVYQ
ncbi:MAG TPA: DUF3465 domain-containing protein [Drouetiella sp.]|jgi:Protein of unknown function (DUF3465)